MTDRCFPAVQVVVMVVGFSASTRLTCRVMKSVTPGWARSQSRTRGLRPSRGLSPGTWWGLGRCAQGIMRSARGARLWVEEVIVMCTGPPPLMVIKLCCSLWIVEESNLVATVGRHEGSALIVMVVVVRLDDPLGGSCSVSPQVCRIGWPDLGPRQRACSAFPGLVSAAA